MPNKFEEKVYRAVKKVPKGEVRSYEWVAKMIGNPGAVRAVGNALNKNPYAPEVPCHRIIRKNGELGGFAAGLKRKRELLLSEGYKC